MPLTDSMEKPPTAGRASGSIAFFSNSYARLPEHFFTRLAPTPVAKPRLIKFNDSLASELGVNTALSRHAFYLSTPCALKRPQGGKSTG